MAERSRRRYGSRDDEPATALATTDRPKNLHEHVLDLQRSYGNRAVTALIVQRRPKDRPASTDAPWVKKKKEAKKVTTPEQEDYSPKEPNPKLQGWSTSSLSERGRQEAESTVRNSLYFAAELFEEYWFRTKDRGVAVAIARVYKKLDDAKRYEFWMGVANGSIKPGQKQSAEDDMSDKQF